MDILQTMCVKEVWGAELQEKEAMLIREKDRALMEAVGEREKVAVMVMGKMRDTGRMVVKDSKTGESLEVARKVTFNPAIRARTVTVEGDVFEPSGIVEGWCAGVVVVGEGEQGAWRVGCEGARVGCEFERVE